MSTKFCPYCGQFIVRPFAPVHNSYVSINKYRAKPNNKKVKIIIGVIVVVILIMLGAHVKNQYITPNVEISEIATNQPWHFRGDDNGMGYIPSGTFHFHENGQYTENDTNNPITYHGTYKFTGKSLKLGDQTWKFSKYSNGTYYYYDADNTDSTIGLTKE